MASPIDCEEIVSILDSIHRRGHSASTVFDDWLDLMLFALQRRDDPYLDIVDKYREDRDMDHPDGQRTVDLFANAFGQLQKRMAETDADVLGAVYEEFGMQSDAFGQHFTSHSLCETKAKALLEEEDGVAEGRFQIGDPACGSGRLLTTAAQYHPDALFIGRDIDSMCARMAALNFLFFNMDGYVIQGDSMKMEVRRVWQTSGSALGGSIRELDDEKQAEFAEAYEGMFEVDESPQSTQEAEPTGEPTHPGSSVSSDGQQVATDGDPQAAESALTVERDQSSLGAFLD